MSYIYQTMNAADIARELLADEYAGWTHAQATALADWMIEDVELKATAEDFDRVAVRCQFAAYDSAIEAAQDYGQEPEDEAAALEYLEANTHTIPCADGSIIVQQF